MRIDSLEIKSRWKNLGDFRISFDEHRDIAVIIGKNGSAKSNLLEAFITIFRDLDLKEPCSFSYEIKYIIEGRKVVLRGDADKQPTAEVDGNAASLDQVRSEWSPRYLVGYYSGVSDRFEELFAKHDLKALDLTLIPPSKTSTPQRLQLRRFIYARPVHGLFALLAFYFSKDKEVDSFLRDFPRIEAFDSALLVVHKPSWARKGESPEDFWGAKGPVRDLLDCIRANSLAPFSRMVKMRRDFSKRETRELVYLYLPDLKSLEAIAAKYDYDPNSLFQALDTMRLSGLIEDFRVRVRVVGAAGAIHTRQLSEGEQQLLTVLGLMRFTRNAGSLYLLDEPDTHLNPSWEVEYLNRLRTIGGIEQNSHTILATHDPMLVAGLLREEIRVLTRLKDGRIIATEPEVNPRGTGVAGVLTSPLYGLESQLDNFSLRALNRIYEVSLMPRSEKRTRHLKRLRKLLPAIETRETSPDPYRNIARDAYQIAQERVLESDQTSDRKKAIIDHLAARLVEESTQESQ
ncbi:MAG TPA: AAA family ATPase [Candidatus Sulfotelmatobacter sp.]|jgi:predicted ATPase|nr:AAA family ATPase [Candidatus Sulfotelmatobacter sp.]